MSGYYDVLVDDFPDVGVNEMRPSIAYVSEEGIPESVAYEVSQRPEIARTIERWMQSVEDEAKGFRDDDVFNRKRYVGSSNIFETMSRAAAAVEGDDVLSTLADTVEGLAFNQMGFELYDDDQEDIWNQIAAGLGLDARLKEMWRELFKVSQFYCAVWWERRRFTPSDDVLDDDEVEAIVSGEDPPSRPGNRTRRKTFDLRVPTALSILDPTKVVPVGSLMFGRERFAYIAERGESRSIERALAGEFVDDMIMRLVERKYNPELSETTKLAEYGIPTDRLWLMREEAVFRHTLTKAQYERFASVRLKSVMEIVDLKRHLRQADRSALVGATNFIVLIKKGTDKLPAKQAEINNLRNQARMVARMPVLVGDHRLNVEIVTPSTDNTLNEDRYNVLDARLVFRALQSFAPNIIRSQTSGSGAVSELSRVVALGIESRRHQLMRTLEHALWSKVVAANEQLTQAPKLKFHPKRVALDVNQILSKSVLELLDRGDISRETALDEFGFDQDIEALRRLREIQSTDKIFRSSVPHDSPENQPRSPRANGRKGGRPPGVVEDEPREVKDG